MTQRNICTHVHQAAFGLAIRQLRVNSEVALLRSEHLCALQQVADLVLEVGNLIILALLSEVNLEVAEAEVKEAEVAKGIQRG